MKFERIDMIMYHGNTGVQYSLANPIITSINFGDIDYADSGFKDIQIQVAYEYFSVFDQLNFNLGEQDLARFERMDSGFKSRYRCGSSFQNPSKNYY